MFCTLDIVEAKDLMPANSSGTSDPYVRVGTIDVKSGAFEKLYRTPTIWGNVSPTWNHRMYDVYTAVGQDICFRLKDQNVLSKPVPIGTCTLQVPHLSTPEKGKVLDVWLPVVHPKWDRGQLHIRASFDTTPRDTSKMVTTTSFTAAQIDALKNGGHVVQAQMAEIELLRLEIAKLHDELTRAGIELPDAPDERTGKLVMKAANRIARLRKLQMELPDKLGDAFAKTLHTSAALNRAEATMKYSLWKSVNATLKSTVSEINWTMWPPTPFGREMRETHFLMNEMFLNSASYGAAPRVVLQSAQKWNEVINMDTASFMIKSRQFLLNQVAAAMCDFLDCDPNDFTFFPNANTATSTVFKSMAWRPGDRILIFSVEYDSTRNAALWLADNMGVEVIDIPIRLPMSDDDLLKQVEKHLCWLKSNPPMPRLANFCHVTSKTAWVFPAKRLTDLFHAYGVPVCIDGAQVPGHIPVSINTIGAEFYIGTFHKWMYAVQGTAFMVVQPLAQRGVTPLTVSYYYPSTFGSEFTYSGLLNYSGFLALCDCLDFVNNVCGGWNNVWQYTNDLATKAAQMFEKAWGTKIFQGDPEHYGRMPIIPLPNGDTLSDMVAKTLMAYLQSSENITVFLPFIPINGRKTLCLRLSVQIYNTMEEYQRLADIISKMKGEYNIVSLATDVAREYLA